jgi:hypothetical protein
LFRSAAQSAAAQSKRVKERRVDPIRDMMCECKCTRVQICIANPTGSVDAQRWFADCSPSVRGQALRQWQGTPSQTGNFFLNLSWYQIRTLHTLRCTPPAELCAGSPPLEALRHLTVDLTYSISWICQVTRWDEESTFVAFTFARCASQVHRASKGTGLRRGGGRTVQKAAPSFAWRS